MTTNTPEDFGQYWQRLLEELASYSPRPEIDLPCMA
jgi:cephalosporin-C deacetylase-like acetyl esterase